MRPADAVKPRRPLSLATIGLCLAASATVSAIVGCESGPEIAPVSGRVLLDGEPLPFGFVRFHPVSGQPAQGEIGSDGGFTMSTVSPGDGAPVGRHRVSVLCFEGHDPARRNSSPGAEVSLGRPLLPIAYTRSGMSGLEIEVPPEGLQDHVIELSSSGPGG